MKAISVVNSGLTRRGAAENSLARQNTTESHVRQKRSKTGFRGRFTWSGSGSNRPLFRVETKLRNYPSLK